MATTYFPDDEHTSKAILARMIAQMGRKYAAGIEGDPLFDLLSAMANELAQGADLSQKLLERSFAQTSFGEYLAMRADEHGVTKRSATKAKGSVTFTGTAGSVVTSGIRVSTASSTTQAAVIFETDRSATIQTGDTTVSVPVTAVGAGVAGNVAADTIQFLSSPISGIVGINNPAALTGGADIETDASLKARYFQKVRSPSAGGNKADYVNWALEVAGVGGVSVVPIANGPGTVSIFIIGTDKKPASSVLTEAVQDYIAPPWVFKISPDVLGLSGHGATIVGNTIEMEYSSSGEGEASQGDIEDILVKPGIWTARVSCSVDDDAGEDDLLQIGIWNASANDWAKTTDGGSVDAVTIKSAADLSTVASEIIQQFYWNMGDNLELRITRLVDDEETTVTVSGIEYVSAFSKDTGEAKAPIGARVSVLGAQAVIINISATLTVLSGYESTSVVAAAKQSVEDYLTSLAFIQDNDVRYVRIGQAILDTQGVQDYDNLLINSDDENISIGEQQVVVSGTINLTT